MAPTLLKHAFLLSLFPMLVFIRGECRGDEIAFTLDFDGAVVGDDENIINLGSKQLNLLNRLNLNLDWASTRVTFTCDGKLRFLVVIPERKVTHVDVTFADPKRAIAEMATRPGKLDGVILSSGQIRVYGTAEEIARLLKAVPPEEVGADGEIQNAGVAIEGLEEPDLDRPFGTSEWTYSELAAKSDLIVVAKVVSKSEIEGDESLATDLSRDTFRWLSHEMRVLSTLKGDAGDDIKVITMGLRPGVQGGLFKGIRLAELHSSLKLPSLVTVVNEGEIVGYVASQPIKTYSVEPEYLLYLRRVDENTFVPVTGQRYSAMSVRILKGS